MKLSAAIQTTILCAFVVLCASQEAADDSDPFIPPIYQLDSYNLDVVVSSETLNGFDTGNTINGEVEIVFTVNETTSQVKLHSSHEYITIQTIQLNGEEVTGSSLNNATDVLTIPSSEELALNVTHRLSITYVAQVSTTVLLGVFKSTYIDKSGTTHYQVATQTAPYVARRVLPCFDEPKFKAFFNVNVTVPSGFSAISNGEVKSKTNLSNDATLYQFHPSPFMSPYTFVFIVSDYTCTSTDDIAGASYSACSRDEATNTRAWALDIGPKLMKILNTYTNLYYGVTARKFEAVVVSDFSYDGMENWGAPVFSETSLLYDPESSSTASKVAISRQMAHYTSYQWFSNLVTMNEWANAWIMTGFAAFSEYYLVDALLPEWNQAKQYVVDTLQSGLQSDVFVNSVPLQFPVSTTNGVLLNLGGAFSKGSGILRMVRYIIGKDAFRAGVRDLVQNYKFKAPGPSELWSSLSVAINNTKSRLPASLEVVMENWYKTAGYPIVKATLKNNTITFTQKRFLLNSNGSDSNQWYVPISYTKNTTGELFEDTYPRAWLVPGQSLTIPFTPRTGWIVINPQQTGFYRVNYDNVLWSRLATALSGTNFSGIIEINRAQIVDDLFNLASIGEVTYQTVFDVISFIQNDASYFTWQPVFKSFTFLINQAASEPTLGPKLIKYLLAKMSTLLAAVPIGQLNSEDPTYTETQVLAQTWACSLGESNCIAAARQQFSAFITNGTKPDKNLRTFVYCTGLKNSSNSNDWNLVYNAYLNTDVESEKQEIISALGCTRQSSILQSFLNLTLTANATTVRPQDRTRVFASVAASSVGFPLALDFVIQNQDQVIVRYQSSNNIVGAIDTLARRINTQADLTKLSNFVENTLDAAYKPSGRGSVARAAFAIKWQTSGIKQLLNVTQLQNL